MAEKEGGLSTVLGATQKNEEGKKELRSLRSEFQLLNIELDPAVARRLLVIAKTEAGF